jgi:hypothetical protein
LALAGGALYLSDIDNLVETDPGSDVPADRLPFAPMMMSDKLVAYKLH